ncbi:MAG: FAD-dependent oxidoreductase [Flavobacteriales bacterium]|mgnify:CR=1 FL=1|jgi:sulfide dehydrogenase [flavocytochrome c] flavoprotein chain|nr:FAD-dependent oxidoreductase [Flavobacteriales bacterium]
MKNFSRRGFGKLTAGSIAGTLVATNASAASAKPSGTMSRPVELPTTKKPRVVVVGGGWAGLTIAQNLRRQSVDFDVVLIERRSTFISHPLSNLWLGGAINLETLTHSFLDAAKAGDYAYLNASLIDLDREKRRAFTDQGYIDYDSIVLAPGIDYNYASMGVKDPTAVQMLKTRYPAGFVSGSEHVTLKRKVDGFKNGIFVLTAPQGIFRCTASVYERACILAATFKRRKLPAKVLLIDSRNAPGVNSAGFLAAFKELYKDHLEYMPSSPIQRIDPVAKTIHTEFDDIKFADGAIYPRVRAARMIEEFGLSDLESAQMEANIDPFNYNIIGDEHTYVAGDSRPMPFSKSASVARGEGVHVAKVIAARAEGKSAPWVTPESICYSMVDPEAKQGIVSRSYYQFNQVTKQWEFAPETVSIDERSKDLGRKTLAWSERQFKDLFS